LSAIIVILINDKVLKRNYPSLMTGKLSDFAGIFALPVFSASLIEITTRRFVNLKIMTVILFTVTVLFIGTKMNAPTSNFIGDIWFQLLRPIRSITTGSVTPVTFVRDTSDLLALISVPVVFVFWKYSFRNPFS